MASEKTLLIPKDANGQSPTTADKDEAYNLWKRIGVAWKKYVAPFLLIFFIVLPMIIYRGDYISFIETTSYAPLAGIVACTIPSGGAPVAGGIVFIPILTMMGIEAHDAVAFTAATQMIGVGIFAPLGWMYKDPDVIMFKSFLFPFFPIGLLGLVAGLLIFPLQDAKEVIFAFTLFIIFLAYYTGRGLVKNELRGAETSPDMPNLDDVDTSKDCNKTAKENNIESGTPHEEKSIVNSSSSTRNIRSIAWTWKAFSIYAVCVFLGGILTSWIGIGVEKITFFLLTAIHDVDVIAAGLSSIVLNGWLSLTAFGFHTLCAPPYDGPGPHWICAPVIEGGMNPDGHVDGNVPFKLWLSVIPGILIGSMIGPKANEMVGPRNVMFIFVIFLCFDIAYNIMSLME